MEEEDPVGECFDCGFCVIKSTTLPTCFFSRPFVRSFCIWTALCIVLHVVHSAFCVHACVRCYFIHFENENLLNLCDHVHVQGIKITHNTTIMFIQTNSEIMGNQTIIKYQSNKVDREQQQPIITTAWTMQNQLFSAAQFSSGYCKLIWMNPLYTKCLT